MLVAAVGWCGVSVRAGHAGDKASRDFCHTRFVFLMRSPATHGCVWGCKDFLQHAAFPLHPCKTRACIASLLQLYFYWNPPDNPCQDDPWPDDEESPRGFGFECAETELQIPKGAIYAVLTRHPVPTQAPANHILPPTDFQQASAECSASRLELRQTCAASRILQAQLPSLNQERTGLRRS